eukprot:EG_transcript_11024
MTLRVEYAQGAVALPYRSHWTGMDLKRHLLRVHRHAVDHLYVGSAELYDSDTLEERRIRPGATVRDRPEDPAAVVPRGGLALRYQRLGGATVPFEVQRDWSLEQVASLIAQREKADQQGFMCLLFSATALLYRGNVGCTPATPVGELGLGPGEVLYPHYIPSELRQEFFEYRLGPRIFDDCVFWQPTRPQTPLALHVFLSALNSLHVDLKRGRYALEPFLEALQRRLHFPPATLAFRRLTEEAVFNCEKHVIAEAMYHLTGVVQPHVTLDDVVFRNAPLVLEELLKDLASPPERLPPIVMTPVRKMTYSTRSFVHESQPDVAHDIAQESPTGRLQHAHFEEFPLCEPLLDGTFCPAMQGIYGANAEWQSLIDTAHAAILRLCEDPGDGRLPQLPGARCCFTHVPLYVSATSTPSANPLVSHMRQPNPLVSWWYQISPSKIIFCFFWSYCPPQSSIPLS